jgi:hypothetical protein
VRGWGLLDRDARVPDLLCGTAGAEEADAGRVQALRELEQAGLVVHRQEGCDAA